MIKQDTLITVGAIFKNHKGIHFTLRSVGLQFSPDSGVEVVVDLYNPKSDLYGLLKLSEFESKVREGIFEIVSEGT